MRSFFIGFAIFLALVPLAPLTMIWVIGERYQGRKGVAFGDGEYPEEPTAEGLTLVVCTILFTIAWAFIIAAICCS